MRQRLHLQAERLEALLLGLRGPGAPEGGDAPEELAGSSRKGLELRHTLGDGPGASLPGDGQPRARGRRGC